MIEILRYAIRTGKDVLGVWLANLKDVRARAKIAIRIARVAAGEFWRLQAVEPESVRLRIDSGTGYRLYYAVLGSTCILLLCGGDKRTQSFDIERAHNYLKDYQERTGTE